MRSCAPSDRRRRAVRQPPQTQPVSSASTSDLPSQPSVDQWPKATTSAAVRRSGTSNQGMNPSGAPCAPSLLLNSIVPSAVQKRRRVSALTITRSRATPCSAPSQRAGSLPYICVRKSFQCGPRSTCSTSAASVRVSLALHWGSTPACTISTPCACRAIACCRSQFIKPSRSGASSKASSVSIRLVRRTPAARASVCRSWLPSRQCALPCRACRRRSTPSESGPRLTRSPRRYKLSRLGEKSRVCSRRPRASSQPCTSPIR